MTKTLVKRIEMALHVQELCAKNDIQVKYVSLEEPEAFYCANRVHKIITVRPTKNTGYYVSALHEIGHLLGPDQHQGCDRMEMEIGAWKYAVAVALVWTDYETCFNVLWYEREPMGANFARVYGLCSNL